MSCFRRGQVAKWKLQLPKGIKLRVNAVFNLLLYNSMFIIPLVIVFVSTFFGVTSEKMASMTKKHTGTVKLLTAILFLALAGLLFLIH